MKIKPYFCSGFYNAIICKKDKRRLTKAKSLADSRLPNLDN